MLRSLRPTTRVLLLVTLLLAALAAGLYLWPGKGGGPAVLQPTRTLVQSGGAGLYPANTLPAIEAALASGVTRLELGVALTRDDVPVLYHDLALDPARTRGPDGGWLDAPVALSGVLADDIALFDVGRVRADSPAAAAFPDQRAVDGARIPRLSAAVAFAERQSDGQAFYVLEVLRAPDRPALTPDAAYTAKTLADSLAALKIVERSAVQSFDWGFLVAFHQLRPEVPLVFKSSEQAGFDTVRRDAAAPSPWLGGLDPAAVEGSLPRLVAGAGGKVWAPDYRDLRAVDLKEAHALDLQVVVWTVNDPAAMASLLDLGVDGIVTDYPERLRAVLADRHQALPAAYPAKTQ